MIGDPINRVDGRLKVTGTAPFTAMIGCTSMRDCSPVVRWMPPRST